MCQSCDLRRLKDENENLRTTVKMDLIYMRGLEAKVEHIRSLAEDWEYVDGDTLRAIIDGEDES